MKTLHFILTVWFRKSIIIISLHLENKRVCGYKVTYTDQGNKKEQKKVFNSNNLVVAPSKMVLCLLLWIKLKVGSAGWKCILKKASGSKDKNHQQNSTHIIFSAHPGFEVGPLWWEADALTAVPPLLPPPSPPYNQAGNKKLTLCLVLMMTGVDKCPVSRLINGVDTIKIEDSGNARTPKYYKVLLSLFFFLR